MAFLAAVGAIASMVAPLFPSITIVTAPAVSLFWPLFYTVTAMTTIFGGGLGGVYYWSGYKVEEIQNRVMIRVIAAIIIGIIVVISIGLIILMKRRATLAEVRITGSLERIGSEVSSQMGDTAIKQEHAANKPCINKTITVDDLQYLSREMTREWRDVARNLKLTHADIYKLTSDFGGNERETIHQMLTLWQRKEGSCATRNLLADALKKEGSTELGEFVLTGVKKAQEETMHTAASSKK